MMAQLMGPHIAYTGSESVCFCTKPTRGQEQQGTWGQAVLGASTLPFSIVTIYGFRGHWTSSQRSSGGKTAQLSYPPSWSSLARSRNYSPYGVSLRRSTRFPTTWHPHTGDTLWVPAWLCSNVKSSSKAEGSLNNVL